MTEGLQSGMSYQGVNNLIQLKQNPEFIKISNAGLIESHPHDIITK
jgi:IMP dehydrogenase